MRDLAYSVCAHKSILDRANTGEIDLPFEQLRFYQTYVNENKSRVREYYTASQTPVEIIDEKISFLDELRSQLCPSPWRPDQTLRPALYSLIAGVISHLKYEKNRFLAESVVLDSDISGFDDAYFEQIIESMATTASWAKPEFCKQWARNIPPFRASPNVNFSTRPTEVSSVIGLFDQDTDTASTEMVYKRIQPPRDPRPSSNSRPALQVSENKADLFREDDSDSDVEILLSNMEPSSLQSI